MASRTAGTAPNIWIAGVFADNLAESVQGPEFAGKKTPSRSSKIIFGGLVAAPEHVPLSIDKRPDAKTADRCQIGIAFIDQRPIGHLHTIAPQVANLCSFGNNLAGTRKFCSNEISVLARRRKAANPAFCIQSTRMDGADLSRNAEFSRKISIAMAISNNSLQPAFTAKRHNRKSVPEIRLI